MKLNVYAQVVEVKPMEGLRGPSIYSDADIRGDVIPVRLDCGHYQLQNPIFTPPQVGERVRCRRCEEAA
jgi:hypothetical protein